MAIIRFLGLAIGILNIIFLISLFYMNFRQTSRKTLQASSNAHNSIIFYNRVPKTGSTTLINAIGYDLCQQNGFHVVYVNFSKSVGRGEHFPHRIDQMLLAENISQWESVKPALYHGHTSFIDFTLFGFRNPIYVNVVREPFERFLSYYYFMRYGDDFRLGLKRKKAGNNESIDECFAQKGNDCDARKFWLQIPFFCGTASFCNDCIIFTEVLYQVLVKSQKTDESKYFGLIFFSRPGSEEALEAAKRNLVKKYLLVGLTERMADTIWLLERLLPSFFRNASSHFNSLDKKRSHMRNTRKKEYPSKETERTLKSSKFYQMEREFYDFAVTEFDTVFKRVKENDISSNAKPQFFYDKIRP